MSGRSIALTALSIGLSVAPAAGQNVNTGTHLRPHCKAWEGGDYNVMSGICAGMAAAIVSLASDLSPRVRACPPNGVTPDQAVIVVNRFFEAHPELLHLQSSGLMVDAIREAWPCR